MILKSRDVINYYSKGATKSKAGVAKRNSGKDDFVRNRLI